MIAGYDYLILRDGVRRFWTRTRIAGASLVIAGGVLIGVGGAYYGYASSARADLTAITSPRSNSCRCWCIRTPRRVQYCPVPLPFQIFHCIPEMPALY